MLVADNQKIVTFIRYEDSDAVQAQTVDEFTTDESFDEWVWHLAPSKEAAIAKHYSAFDEWEETGQDYFVHIQ